MSAKRGATSNLNHDNWDREEEAEDAGFFQKAPDTVLKQRIIKTAKRRSPQGSVKSADESDGSQAKNVFGGFTAFAKTPANPSTAFTFLSSNSNSSSSNPLTNGTAFKDPPKTDSSAKTDLFSFGSAALKKTTSDNTSKSLDSKGEAEDKGDEYYAKLKGLNESVLSWIEKHVKENPFINLEPVFKDYEKYMKELDIKNITVSAETKKELGSISFKASAEKNNNTGSVAEPKTNDTGSNKITFGIPSAPSIDKKLEVPKFTFGVPPSNNTSGSIFGSGPPSGNSLFGGPSTTNTISFGAANKTPFMFSNVQSNNVKTSSTTQESVDEEENDEPPKVEFTPVVEEGHVYTVKCKVFVKKDGNFGDRGVGNLYLKPVPDSDKVQLIVRANTSLGNLLCNFILSKNIPTQRMGKKDVMLVCLPTPDAKPPPVPVLLRVKTPEEADELLQELEKRKK